MRSPGGEWGRVDTGGAPGAAGGDGQAGGGNLAGAAGGWVRASGRERQGAGGVGRRTRELVLDGLAMSRSRFEHR